MYFYCRRVPRLPKGQERNNVKRHQKTAEHVQWEVCSLSTVTSKCAALSDPLFCEVIAPWEWDVLGDWRWGKPEYRAVVKKNYNATCYQLIYNNLFSLMVLHNTKQRLKLTWIKIFFIFFFFFYFFLCINHITCSKGFLIFKTLAM